MGLNDKAIKLIRKYQDTKDQTIGSGRCKHYPSCSNYSIECYEKFNFIKASFLTAFRIIRCNPFTKKTYDPVPLTKEEKNVLKIRHQNALEIIPYLKKFISNNPNMDIDAYITFIYNFTFKDNDIDDFLISKYYDYLSVFKSETKKKHLNLDYKKVSSYLNDYLSKPFEKRQ